MRTLLKLFYSKKTKEEIMFAEKKFLIVGLGNIGEKYRMTRHNAGFLCADELSLKYKGQFSDGRYGFTSTIKIKNKSIILLKPSTFMNLSGKAVFHYMNKEKIAPDNMLIIADDIALPFGQIRIRKKGGAGGHNGLQDIIDVLGNSEFARIRVGIGNEYVKGYQSDYVLGEWDETQKEFLSRIIQNVVGACETFVQSGIDSSMNQFNRRDNNSLDK
jgi:peptidyl-tRNA hydrolase, PTH1 family